MIILADLVDRKLWEMLPDPAFFGCAVRLLQDIDPGNSAPAYVDRPSFGAVSMLSVYLAKEISVRRFLEMMVTGRYPENPRLGEFLHMVCSGDRLVNTVALLLTYHEEITLVEAVELYDLLESIGASGETVREVGAMEALIEVTRHKRWDTVALPETIWQQLRTATISTSAEQRLLKQVLYNRREYSLAKIARSILGQPVSDTLQERLLQLPRPQLAAAIAHATSATNMWHIETSTSLDVVLDNFLLAQEAT